MSGEPINFFDPFNPISFWFALLSISGLSVLLCNNKNKNIKLVSIVLIVVLIGYYFVPNFYMMIMWYLVNKLHWIP